MTSFFIYYVYKGDMYALYNNRRSKLNDTDTLKIKENYEFKMRNFNRSYTKNIFK